MDWKRIVSSIAPTFATALGGPMAGMATKAIAGALLGDESASDTDIEAAIINASPADLAKLREADNAFKAEMKRLDVDLEKIVADDRESARQREIQTKDKTPSRLAAVVIIGFFVTLATVAFAPISDSAIQPVNILLGALTALLIQVGNYYFGSSAGSKAKTDLLGAKK